MTWQAFIDESVDDEFIVFAGYIATAERWEAFSAEWERLLPYASLAKDNSYQFKMSSMAVNSERMDRARAFYRVIKKHAQVGFVSILRISDYESAKSNILIYDNEKQCDVTLPHPILNSPYVFMASFSMLWLWAGKDRFNLIKEIQPHDMVSFCFDERSDKKHISDSYETIRSAFPAEHILSPPPRFENDQKFLPLQAADFQAYWAREGAHGRPLPWPMIDTGMQFLRIKNPEDAIFSGLRQWIRLKYGNRYEIVDRRHMLG